MRINKTKYSTKQIINWLWRHHKNCRIQALLNVLIGLSLVGLGLLSVDTIRSLTDIATHAKEGSIIWMAVLLGCVFLAEMLMHIAFTWISAVLGVKTQNQMQQFFFRQLIKGKWRGIEKYHSGDVINYQSQPEVYYLYEGNYYRINRLHEGDYYRLSFTANGTTYYLTQINGENTITTTPPTNATTRGALIWHGVLYEKITKIWALREAVVEFVKEIVANNETLGLKEGEIGNRVAIVLYDGAVYTNEGLNELIEVTDFSFNASDNKQLIYNNIDIIGYDTGAGTNSWDAMDRAYQILSKVSSAEDRTRTVVMFTDGEPTGYDYSGDGGCA